VHSVILLSCLVLEMPAMPAAQSHQLNNFPMNKRIFSLRTVSHECIPAEYFPCQFLQAKIAAGLFASVRKKANGGNKGRAKLHNCILAACAPGCQKLPNGYFYLRPVRIPAAGGLRAGFAATAAGLRTIAAPGRGLFCPNFCAIFAAPGVSLRRSSAIMAWVGA
jgi:hypothetical protein